MNRMVPPSPPVRVGMGHPRAAARVADRPHRRHRYMIRVRMTLMTMQVPRGK